MSIAPSGGSTAMGPPLLAKLELTLDLLPQTEWPDVGDVEEFAADLYPVSSARTVHPVAPT